MVYRRRQRKPGPPLPGGQLELEPPPDLPVPSPRSIGQLLIMLPMLAMVGAMMLMYVGRGAGASGGPMWIVGGLFGVAMLGMMGGSFLQSGGSDRQNLTNERRDYMRYLAQSRRRVRRAADQQRRAMVWRHPAPEHLWTVAASVRLWERRPVDADFCEVRVSVGEQRLAVALKTPETKPVEDLEPMSAMALRRFVKAQSSVPGIPIAVQLRAFRRIMVRGDDDTARGLVRAALAQLATFHAPDDLLIAVVADPARRRDWEWLKWLPHSQHSGEQDAVGPRRLVVGQLAELEDLLAEPLSGRNRFDSGVAAVHQGCHVVVVQDGGEVGGNCRLTGPGVSGTTVIEFHPQPPRRMQPWLLCLDVRPDTVTMTHGDTDTPLGAPDVLSVTRAAALARQLSRFRLATAVSTGEPLSVSMELPDLLGIGDAGALDVRRTWSPDRRDNLRLTIPVGLDPQGGRVLLDFKEAAQGGMGPHGLIIGATGSGKSELLRTIVSALAITHSSEELNFVLVDFKGGATFATLDRLPHTSAVITNLADELHLVDRMADAINGELIRRQELLRDAGNYVSQRDYERERRAGAALAPLPSLLIICDEFSELLSAQPEFIDLFVQIGRLGRSLGVHLLLASQRLEEGRLRGLDTHLSYRIGLRTFSAIESRSVLGVPDAYELPQAPGHGYLKVDQETMLRFRGAYVSGPYHSGTGGMVVRDGRVVAGVRPYTAAYQEPPAAPEPAESTAPAAPGQPETAAETLLSVLTRRLEGQGPPAHQVWLPPLDAPPSLDTVYTRLDTTPQRGLHAPDWPHGTLQVAFGLVDKPFEQRRELLTADLSGAGGNVAIVGGPQSGKTTLLRSLIGGLALTHTPAEVQFYCVDLGGGGLRGMRDLPHVGGVGSRQQTEVTRRIVAQVMAVIDDREARFAELGVDSMAAYRRLRANGEETDPLGDVFLVIDGWVGFRDDFEPLDDAVLTLVQRGLGFGVHVVVTCNRWMDLRPAMRDLMTTRVELKLGDPLDSEIDRKAARNVPERSPGRGLVTSGHAVLSALPRIDGSPEVDDLSEGVAAFAAASAAAWSGPRAEPVKLLPRRIDVAELPSPEAGAPVAVGITEERLAPLGLDFASDPHLLVLGDGECGKTNLMRTLIHQLCRIEAARPPKLVVVDYRRTLLGEVPEDNLVAYAPNAETARNALRSAVSALQDRLPGKDVTPEQLRARNWWTGNELYILVDDYDLVATQQPNPVHQLVDLLPQARDIGFHLILARRMGGAARALYEPGIQRLVELQAPTLLMSGPRDLGRLIGDVKVTPQPPGRGTLIHRDGNALVQTAWTPSRYDAAD
nr:type VII secretion protein EccCa [Stackebrandtia albiflava]